MGESGLPEMTTKRERSADKRAAVARERYGWLGFPGGDAGDRVRFYRKRKGWTQEELAKEAGVNIETVGRIEAGGNTRLDTLDAVLRALGQTPESQLQAELAVVKKYEAEHRAARQQDSEELAPEDRALLAKWRRLTAEEKSALELMIDGRLATRERHPDQREAPSQGEPARMEVRSQARDSGQTKTTSKKGARGDQTRPGKTAAVG